MSYAKKEFSINYRTVYFSSAIYHQTINVTEKNYQKFCKYLANKKCKDYYTNLFKDVKMQKYGSVIQLNLTQSKEFARFFNVKILDRNTCLHIINKGLKQ